MNFFSLPSVAINLMVIFKYIVDNYLIFLVLFLEDYCFDNLHVTDRQNTLHITFLTPPKR